MKQELYLPKTVFKKSDTTQMIEVGDDVDLVLADQSVATVTLTAVGENGRRITWSSTTVLSEQVACVDGNHDRAADTNASLHDEPSDSQQADAPLDDGTP